MFHVNRDAFDFSIKTIGCFNFLFHFSKNSVVQNIEFNKELTNTDWYYVHAKMFGIEFIMRVIITPLHLGTALQMIAVTVAKLIINRK